MRVLIVIDVVGREYLASKLVAQELNERGIKAALCSKLALTMTYNRFKPDVVILPKTHKIKFLNLIHQQSVVLLAQAESFLGSVEAYESFSKFIAVDCVDGICCWGKIDYDYYIGNPRFSNIDVQLTGHPIIEFWYGDPPKVKSKKKPTVGIAFSLRVLCNKNHGNSINPLSVVIDLDEVGDSGYFIPPYHSEDWIAFEASWVRVVATLIKENPDIHFNLRPHIHENIHFYEVFNRFSNVTVSSTAHISEWLTEVDVVLTAFSTSMLDAYFLKKQVISMRNLIPKHILNGIHPAVTDLKHEIYFNAPGSQKDFRSLLKTKPSKIPGLDEFGKVVFNYPAARRPSEKIVDFIEQKAVKLSVGKKGFSKLKERWFEQICGNFLWSPHVFMVIAHIRDLILRDRRSVTSYKLHNFIHNKKYDKLISYIRSSR